MSRVRPGALSLLARRWVRTPSSRQVALVVATTWTVLTVVYLSVAAFTLDREQLADKRFGAYAATTYSSVDLGDLPPGTLASARAAVGADHRNAVSLESTQVLPDPVVKRYYQGPIPNLRYVEDPDLRNGSPGRYEITRGRWPTQPGEVAITAHLADSLPDPSRFTVLSGRADLEVVGIVEDSYARAADTIVAGPGTWETLPSARPDHEFQPVEGAVTLWAGRGADVADLARRLTAALPAAARPEPGQLEGNLSSRTDPTADPPSVLGTGQPVVSVVPLLLVVLLVGALVVGQVRRPHLETRAALVRLGVDGSTTSSARAVALLVVTVSATALGIGLGYLLGAALRPTVLDAVADQPLSPLSPPEPSALLVALAAAALVVAGVTWPERSADRRRSWRPSDQLAGLDLALIRRAGVLLLLVCAVKVGTGAPGAGPSSTAAAYLSVAAVLLVAPDLLRLAVRLLSAGRADHLVVRRLVEADLLRNAAAVVVVGICVAAPIASTSQLVSKQASDASQTFGRIPDGQLWVQRSVLSGDSGGVAGLVADLPGMDEPVVLSDMNLPPGEPAPDTRAASFTNLPTTGLSSQVVAVANSVEDLRRVVGDDYPEAATTVLLAGGVLDFTSAASPQSFEVFTAAGEVTRTAELPTLHVAVDRSLQAQFGGAVLRQTVDALDLPSNPPTTWVFPDADGDDVRAAVAVAVDEGYDSEFVQFHVEPPAPRVPTDAWVYLLALSAAAVVVLGVVVRGQAHRLRAYGARLVAIGLPRRWTLRVLGLQVGLVVGLGVILGVLGGLLAVVVTSDNYLVVEIPYQAIGVLCAVSLIASAFAVAVGMRRLTSRDLHEPA